MSAAAPLTPRQAIERAVGTVGSQAALARRLGVSQPSVWRWLHAKAVVPGEYVIAIETATGISRHDLRPDLYPHESAPADRDAA